ncbi:hypothetical protein N7530_011225 [Penicillium desertorum]|uniref:Uncharacterized protein n=1 Tax=Penicillium desertorum TaxID=1303715 RepID=A0A9W9WGT5_9EURO|nr:hypothetical protein N7530_011225 [Penicillium desertorum]
MSTTLYIPQRHDFPRSSNPSFFFEYVTTSRDGQIAEYQRVVDQHFCRPTKERCSSSGSNNDDVPEELKDV